MRTRNARMSLTLPALLALALLAGACTEDAARVCSSDQQCADKAAAGSIDQSWTKCYPEGYCSKPCSSDADCKPPFWKDGLVCNTTESICIPGTPSDGGEPDMPRDAGPDDIDSATDAEGDTLPPDTINPDAWIPEGQPCTPNGTPCQDGKPCIDGVCCNTTGATCGDCMRCDAPGSKGTCTVDDAFGNTAGHCLRTNANDLCDGTCQGGSCDFAATDGTVCGAVTCTTPSPTTDIEETRCSAGVCNDVQTRTCADNVLCKANACLTGCVTHTDCAGGPNALCDRTNAHVSGLGTCVDPTTVTVVNSTNIASLSNPGTAWAKLSAGSYTGINIQVSSGTLRIAGPDTGTAELTATTTAPIFDVTGTAKVTLQGLTLTGSGSGTASDAVRCFVGTPGPELLIVETTIGSSAKTGISATNCSLELRRSTIQGNDGGGLNLSAGTFVIANSLIESNGKGGPSGSVIGGVFLGAGSTLTFQHNTVAFNNAKTGVTAGVECGATTDTLEASIVAGSGTLTSKCQPGTSQIGANACALDGSYKPTAAICKGQSTAGLTLDRDSAPRPTNADLGCYEVP